MTNEQREAIELAKEFTKMDFSNPMGWTGYYDAELEELSQAIETVLSLIKEQQGEIEGLKNKEVLIKRYFKKCDLIKQKDKQIELMAKYWNTGLAMCDNCDKIVEKYEKNNCQDCIKQYFERKVEDVKD